MDSTDSEYDSLKTQYDKLSRAIAILNEYLDDPALSQDEKLLIVKFLDRMNLKSEFLEFELGIVMIDDQKIAARRLSQKSQSAFGNENAT